MKKRIFVMVMAIMVSFLTENVFGMETESDYVCGESMEKEEFENKLIEAFPNLEDEIRNANNMVARNRSSETPAVEKDAVVYRESKWVDENELIGISFYEDGAYSAYSLLTGEGKKNWIGGTTSSGTAYKNVTDATLTVSNSYYLYTVTIFPISYSLVSGGYDSFIDTGIAVSPLDSCLLASPVQMKETASSPAYAYYNAKNVLILNQSQQCDFPIEIRISNNNVSVYLFNVQI